MNEEKIIRSYYHYPLRSLYRHKRAYLLLAASVFCMIVLCTSVLIYYSSRYEADVETLRRTYGPQHTQFYDVEPEDVSLYTEHPYVETALCPELYASADNPDPYASFSQVFFTPYTEEISDFFYVSLTAGRMPEAFGEILVSESAARYFSCFTLGEEQSVTVLVRGGVHPISFRVVGTFSGAQAADQYVFVGEDTAAYLKGDGSRGYDYRNDIYLIFKGNSPTAARRGMQKLITDLGMSNTDEEGNESAIYYDQRNEMLSEVASIRPFYEGSTMQLMFLFSVLPAAIALTVFIYLDMQKNLGELATLSMIGATWIQIFRMQMLKYGIIYCIVFPFGPAAAAGLMALVCFFTNRISPDKVFLWFRFDAGFVLVLFIVSAAILTAAVWLLARKMTAVAHSEMLSAVHASGNIFVAKTSNLLFANDHIPERISILFFTRNRRVNKLFCLVIILLFCIYSFFTMQITREYGAAPDADTVNQADFYLYGDAAVSEIYDTMDPALQEELEDIPGVASVRRTLQITDFYTDVDEITVEANIKKQLVSNDVKDGSASTAKNMRIWKRNVTDVRLIGMDMDLLAYKVNRDTVDGDIANLFENDDTIALVVHGWSENEKYYHMTDKLALRLSCYDYDSEKTVTDEWKDFTVGAVIYRPDDDAYEDIITVYCSPVLFEKITGIGDIYSYSVVCTDDKDETLSSVRESLRTLEMDWRFTVTDTHEELRQAKEQALHTVMYIYIMKFFVLLVAVLLLIAMSNFMLEVRAPSMRAMYLIGAEHRQLSRMNVIEFFTASVFSSVVGILISLIGTSVVAAAFKITMYHTPVSSLLIALSMIFLTAINVLIPIWISLRRKETYRIL